VPYAKAPVEAAVDLDVDLVPDGVRLAGRMYGNRGARQIRARTRTRRHLRHRRRRAGHCSQAIACCPAPPVLPAHHHRADRLREALALVPIKMPELSHPLTHPVGPSAVDVVTTSSTTGRFGGERLPNLCSLESLAFSTRCRARPSPRRYSRKLVLRTSTVRLRSVCVPP